VAQLTAFSPWAWPALGLAALTALVLLRRRALGTVLVAAMVAAMVWLLPAPSTAGPGTGTPVRLLSVNAQMGGADPARLAAAVRDRRIDVLVVVELTPGLDAALRARPEFSALPYRVSRAADGVTGSGIYSRYALSAAPQVNGTSFAMATARVSVPGQQPWRLAAVHTFPPVPGAESSWDADFAAVRQWVANGDRAHLVLAGDFNATPDHRQFRDLTADGLVAAHQGPLRPFGGGTWPSGVPLLTLDHVLVGDALRSSGYDIVRVDGTDHRAVAVTVRQL
jgi:endonuclease/exonuclease/phosphatase family metal-dependent hydrolase